MIAGILEAAGLEPGRYTSPHVTEYRERITRGNSFFEEALYEAAGGELQGYVQALEGGRHPLFDPRHPGGEAPSFFELLTLYFFICCRLARTGALAVETGMGGRLDATNILDPRVSVITSIELEHTEYLGDTLAAIAEEKAGIIKPGRPLILMEQEPEALEVFRAGARAKGAPLLYLPERVVIEDISVDKEGSRCSLSFKPDPPSGLAPPLRALSLPVPGEIQGMNAAAAILAVRAAFPGIEERAIREGLWNSRLPARFERVREDPPVIIDGAHTPRSAALSLDTFSRLYGEGGILLFGCAAGKDSGGMAEILCPRFSRIIITKPGSFKTSFPEETCRLFQAALDRLPPGSAKPELSLIPGTGRAIDTALEAGRQRGLPVLGTGSFYLAAEIRTRLAAHDQLYRR
jgi:dihydrofolate synthase/folylpolyglutamate synthase